MMAPFEILEGGGPSACVVRLSGDVDMAVVPQLRDALDATLDTRCANVVLDLAAVTYADSSALGLLVWLDHRLRPAGGRLILAGAGRDVSRILELSGLVSVAASIGMSSSVSAALEGLELEPVSTELLWERELRMPADVNVLGEVREEVVEFIEPLGFPESTLFDVKVALGEALANAIRHGAPETGEGDVRVLVRVFGDRLVLEILDNGTGFDGRHAGSDDVYAPNGRGIMFMRALMDRVEFESSPSGGTLVRLTKHRPGTRP
jgi:anti-anti-sigma factor